MTTPKRWQEIDGIFAAALERDSAERPAFLATACGGDEQLRAEVESLIGHVVPETLVERRALEEATHLLGKRAVNRVKWKLKSGLFAAGEITGLHQKHKAS